MGLDYSNNVSGSKSLTNNTRQAGSAEDKVRDLEAILANLMLDPEEKASINPGNGENENIKPLKPLPHESTKPPLSTEPLTKPLPGREENTGGANEIEVISGGVDSIAGTGMVLKIGDKQYNVKYGAFGIDYDSLKSEDGSPVDESIAKLIKQYEKQIIEIASAMSYGKKPDPIVPRDKDINEIEVISGGVDSIAGTGMILKIGDKQYRVKYGAFGIEYESLKSEDGSPVDENIIKLIKQYEKQIVKTASDMSYGKKPNPIIPVNEASDNHESTKPSRPLPGDWQGPVDEDDIVTHPKPLPNEGEPFCNAIPFGTKPAPRSENEQAVQ